MDFETAGKKRDAIVALQSTGVRQKTDTTDPNRHTRTSESDKSIPKIYWLLAVVLVAAVVLATTKVLDFTVAIVVAYAVFLITSVVMGILAPGKGFFPAENAKFVRIGMIVWFFGDALVGLSMIPGGDHSTPLMVATLANNFIWWVFM